jgi:NAD(P)-dependent dehydrogenase (short-subunit alcohol dehydrogenase family)
MSGRRFDGKTVVITGGASGIGRACALAFGAEGASIVIADINDPRLAEVRAELEALGVPVLAVRCDVSRDEDVDALAAQAEARFGQVDVLMNNAGVMLRGPPEAMPIADWEWIFGINFFGPLRGVRAFLPAMIARGSGHIVNTASIGGLIGGRWHSAGYSASKFALVGLSETLCLYLKPKGVGVSVLCPGGVTTNLPEQFRLSSVVTDPAPYDMDETFGPGATTPEAVAALVLDAVEADQFLILTDPSHQPLLARKAADPQGYINLRTRAGGAKRA